MTKLRNRKSRLIFTTADEINDRGKYRAVVIEAQPTGTRTAFPVSYGAIYHLAARIAAEAERREKKATRNPRRR
jgi:hypothetical protein